MNKIRRIAFSLAALTVLFLISPSAADAQNMAAAESQGNESCQNNRNQIAYYQGQIKDLFNIRNLHGGGRSSMKDDYKALRRAAAAGRIAEFIRDRSDRKVKAEQYNIEWIRQWETDHMTYQVELRNKLQQLLEKSLRYGSANEVDVDISNAQRQIAYHKNRLGILNCDGERSDWAGTYVAANGKDTVTISGSGRSLSAISKWDASHDNGSQGTDRWSDCKPVTGNKVECKWTGQQKDNDKTSSRKGIVEATLDGDTIHIKYTEDEPTFNWKGGVPLYASKMRKGAIWLGTYKRKN